MNPAYRGATIQGIASVVSAVITILLLGLTFKSTQRAEQAESQAHEVIENAKKQAEAMDALAAATREQSQILQDSLKPNMLLQFRAEPVTMPDQIRFTDTFMGMELVNLSDGLIYVEHACFWKDRGPTIAIAPAENKRIIRPGETALLQFVPQHIIDAAQPSELARQYPLGVAWSVNFTVAYTFEKTGQVRHQLGGTVRSMEGQDPTLRYYSLALEVSGVFTRYRLHNIGRSFSCEKVTD
ncbi:hypothetical protein [Deinococcus misasensis]|uniref:hypothetical protein n=1 Tax=Deinococcus misasensis TaxID=392413 RepID=UPI0012F853F0|nr:hypothetical protein [Deinococcus misasensis]